MTCQKIVTALGGRAKAVSSYLVERTYLNEPGILVTDSKIVFSRRIKSNVYEELTFFNKHVVSARLTVETTLPNYLGTFLLVVGALTAVGGAVGVANASTEATGALIIGVVLLVIGVLVNRANKRRDNYSVALQTSSGDVRIVNDLSPDGALATRVVEAVTKAVLENPGSRDG